MGYAIGTVTNSGGAGLAYHQVLAVIKALAEANGWTTLRYVATGDDRELIMRGEGLSGTEEIFVGFKCYHSVAADYYNIAAATMVGYVAGNSFEAQPGISISGVPCHNNAVTYFITANAQRIVGCFKVGTPVYEHFYVGKFFQYARPGEYPSPLIAAGMLNGAAATRFSDTVHRMPYVGYGGSGAAITYLRMRKQDGAWATPSAWPWHDANNTASIVPNGNYLAGLGSSSVNRCLVKTGTGYHPLPVVLHDTAPGVYGELDGVFFISGMDNGTENVLQIGGTHVNQAGMTAAAAVAAVLAAGGRALVVLQENWRTGWNNFVALEMR